MNLILDDRPMKIIASDKKKTIIIESPFIKLYFAQCHVKAIVLHNISTCIFTNILQSDKKEIT